MKSGAEDEQLSLLHRWGQRTIRRAYLRPPAENRPGGKAAAGDPSLER